MGMTAGPDGVGRPATGAPEGVRPAEPWREWDILGERSGSVRFPKIPRRQDLDSDELPDWDQFQVRYEKIQRDKYQLKFRHRIAGGFFGLMCSPPLASALTVAGRAVGEQQGKPGRYTAADHEFIDLVLSFDSGHWVCSPTTRRSLSRPASRSRLCGRCGTADLAICPTTTGRWSRSCVRCGTGRSTTPCGSRWSCGWALSEASSNSRSWC